MTRYLDEARTHAADQQDIPACIATDRLHLTNWIVYRGNTERIDHPSAQTRRRPTRSS